MVTGVEVARSFGRRLLGLMGRSDLSKSALLIPGCGSVHTWFMRGRIDIVFLDRIGRVAAVHREIPPWRFVLGPSIADATLELPPGAIHRHAIEIEDLVECQFI